MGVGALGLENSLSRVDVVDDPLRGGFTYATLPGHPESGEEQFLLEQQDDGRIYFTITAFSKPASTVAKLGGPVGRAAQWLVTERYLRALDRIEERPEMPPVARRLVGPSGRRGVQAQNLYANVLRGRVIQPLNIQELPDVAQFVA